jgi:F-type H+-transporting ATPase subunit b
MDSLIETFHIDVKLLIAQVINFAIVFSVLYFFALKPLLKIMQKRTETIEKSLDDAKRIEENLEKTEADYNKRLSEAKKEAGNIMEKANKLSEEKKGEMIKKAKEEIGQIIESEKAKMQTEKAKTLKEIKREVAELVIDSLEKILEEKIDLKKDKELIKKAVRNNLS